MFKSLFEKMLRLNASAYEQNRTQRSHVWISWQDCKCVGLRKTATQRSHIATSWQWFSCASPCRKRERSDLTFPYRGNVALWPAIGLPLDIRRTLPKDLGGGRQGFWCKPMRIRARLLQLLSQIKRSASPASPTAIRYVSEKKSTIDGMNLRGIESAQVSLSEGSDSTPTTLILPP